MEEIEYQLGRIEVLGHLFPPGDLADPNVGLTDLASVVAHYTDNSLRADGFPSPHVTAFETAGVMNVSIKLGQSDLRLGAFAEQHQQLFAPDAGGLAINGKQGMEAMGVWNPMAGFPVNANEHDGLCKWHLFPPLGLNVIGQRGLLLMHYPPWQVLQQGGFLEVMTMHRWNVVLKAAGVPEDDVSFYRTFIDVNPIAAPGSGQSEYPNDYFPIMMASAFFDNAPDRDYIRTMLRLYLNAPEGRGKNYTLPILICGSPLYDPQAPGWFRVAYKDHLPVDRNGTPTVDVLQAGKFRAHPDSTRETPYMVANHMIAAGVTGKCPGGEVKPGVIPDIRTYEAQDLVAATFLHSYAQDPDLDPVEAKRRACLRWFGNVDGTGIPKPPNPHDDQIICALAQMDLFFVGRPRPHPKYTFEEAMARCASAENDPCGCQIGPPEGIKRG